MKMPPGFDEENSVLKLDKALYGLKQAGRQWYLMLKRFLEDNEYKPTTAVALANAIPNGDMSRVSISSALSVTPTGTEGSPITGLVAYAGNVEDEYEEATMAEAETRTEAKAEIETVSESWVGVENEAVPDLEDEETGSES
jgi:hypothetical protein